MGKKIFKIVGVTTTILLLGVVIILLIAFSLYERSLPTNHDYENILVSTGEYDKYESHLDSQLHTGEAKFAFDYSDSMLSSDSLEVSPDMAKMTSAIAAACYSKEYIRSSLTDMGYTNIVSYWYQDNPNDPYYWQSTSDDYSRVAFNLAKKTTIINNESSTIYSVCIRGTKSREWYGDLDVGNPFTSGETNILEHEHEGFKKACEDWLLPYLYDYIYNDENYNYNNTYIWVTGHSRGAAIANLVGHHLNIDTKNDKSIAPLNHIFTYTYACPNVQLLTSNDSETNYAIYPSRPTLNLNIYNYINPGDYVTCMPLRGWGFYRFGTDIYLDTSEYILNSMKSRFKIITGYNYAGSYSCDDFNSAFLAWCPTFYDAVMTPDQSFDNTFITIMPKLAPFLGKDGSLSSALGLIRELNTSVSNYDTLCLKALMSLIDYAFNNGPNISSGGFAQAHCNESYISWINAMYLGDNAIQETNVVNLDLTYSCATSIGTLAFYNNPYLSTINLSENITRIDAFAFMKNNSLEFIYIPKSVTLIGSYAFSTNDNLKVIKFEGNAPANIDETTFNKNTTIYIKRNTTGWNVVDNKLYNSNVIYYD